MIPGLYESVDRSWEATLKMMARICSMAGSNVELCNRSTFELSGVRFLVTTLWTHIDLDLREECTAIIAEGSSGRQHITADDTSSWFDSEIQWLRSQLSDKPVLPTVILTHHAPSMGCLGPDIDPTEALAQLYCSELDELFYHPVICWAYGRTQFPMDCHAGTVRLVSNPVDYQQSNIGRQTHRSYRSDFVLKI